MKLYLLLSFCFLVCNQINFGMWPDKDSSLYTFQKEALQEKKAFLDTLYLDIKHGDIKEKINKHVAKRYKTHHFNKDIAHQPIVIASWNFSKQSLEDQKAIIKYSNPQQQTLLHLLQLPPDTQKHIIQYLFSGDKQEGAAIKKFFKDPVAQVYENLALAKEYNKKNNNFDISEWFLLDTAKQYATVLKFANKERFIDFNAKLQMSLTVEQFETVEKFLKEERFIKTNELAIIQSLPTCIKTHPVFKNKTYTRDYEWHEKVQYLINESIHFSTRLKSDSSFMKLLEIFCLATDGLAYKFDPFNNNIFGFTLWYNSMLVGVLSSAIPFRLKDVLGKKNYIMSNTIPTATIGMGNIVYGITNDKSLPFYIGNMLCGYGLMSAVNGFAVPERPLPTIQTSLDNI